MKKRFNQVGLDVQIQRSAPPVAIATSPTVLSLEHAKWTTSRLKAVF
jgi:hypothetical protein